MTTNMDRPPVATTEGQQIHQTNTTTESRCLAAVQGTDDPATSLFDYLWDERPGWVCLATDHRIRDIKSERKKTAFHNAAWYSWPEDRSKIWAYAEQVMNSREVWFTPAQFKSKGRKMDNAIGGRICQVDADHTDEWTEEETATRLALLVELNAAVVKSGTNGNFHAYIKLDRDTPRDVIDGLNAQLTAAFAGDSTKENASSVLRMPGTFNHKTDPSNAVVLERLPEGFPGWGPAELASLLPETQKTPTAGRSGAIVRREPAVVPDSLDDCRTLADCLSLPSDHPDRGNNWLTRVAGFEARNVQDYETLLAKLRAYNAASADPMGDDQVHKVSESVWNREQAKKKGVSADALAAKLKSGEMGVAEAVESWEDFDEKVFNDIAGLYIRDVAQNAYFGPLLKLAETDQEAFDATAYARMELLRQIARVRGEEKAKTLAAPGNKELGQPSRRSDCTDVVYDTTAPGLFLHSGRITLAMADYESGKTMLAYSLASERIRKGEEAVIIQEDEHAGDTWRKMDAFCLTEDEEARFHPYNYPGWNLVSTPELLDQLMKEHPGTTLVVVDSLAKQFDRTGLEESNEGTATLWGVFERFLAKHPQVSFMVIDHIGHGGNGHGRGATNKAQMSPIVLQISSVKKFTRVDNGCIKVKVHKHRDGISTGHTWRGDVTVRDGDTPLQFAWTDLGVGKSGDGSAPKDEVQGVGASNKVKTALRLKSDWMTVKELMEAAGLARPTVTKEINAMVEKGAVRKEPDLANPNANRFLWTG